MRFRGGRRGGLSGIARGERTIGSHATGRTGEPPQAQAVDNNPFQAVTIGAAVILGLAAVSAARLASRRPVGGGARPGLDSPRSRSGTREAGIPSSPAAHESSFPTKVVPHASA